MGTEHLFSEMTEYLGPHGFKGILLLEGMCSLNNLLAMKTSVCGGGEFQLLELFGESL